MDNKNIKKAYPESELTSKVINCVFKVYKNLGYGLPERVYQKAMAKELNLSQVPFKRECYGKIMYRNEVIGRYFLDFLVDQRVAVELKVRNHNYSSDEAQLLGYLRSNKVKVGLLLTISNTGVKIKRFVC